MATKSILIKKYENRRLYDATNSRYVNLEEVADFVQRGYDVRVVDVASGEDITRLILTQIIADGAKTPDSGFPIDILRQMVIASGRASQEGALRYTKAMLDLYQNAYKAMVPALNPFDFLRNSPESATREAETASTPAPSSAATNGRDMADVNRLKERVAELERLVSSMASKPSPRKRSRRKSSPQKK